MLHSAMDIRKSLSIGILLTTSAMAQMALTAEDRAAIQALMGQYSQALGACKGAEFADLFTSNGIFASGFRGRMTGRDRLIKLVESERQCTAPTKAGTARPGGAAGPTVAIEATPTGARGIASLGTAEYEDEYVKTPQGWRFASRTVITTPEKTAGLSAAELIAIEKLAGGKLGDYYEADQNGVQRLMTSGVRVTVTNGQVTGHAYLKDGSYDDEVYEKLGPGQWKVKSSTHVAKK